MIQAISKNLQNNLDQVIQELELYQQEADLWIVTGGINNSAGNLALHLIGNLKHFIGAVLGQNGFIRERDKEFSSKNIPREEIIQALRETKTIIGETLLTIPESMMEKDFPVSISNHQGNAGFQLIRLTGHLNYHLGQINYHRRLLTANLS